MTIRECQRLMEDIYDTGCLRALDLVEVNPDLSDPVGASKTVDAGVRLVLASLGEYRGGRPPLN